jgi:hypothetical protein
MATQHDLAHLRFEERSAPQRDFEQLAQVLNHAFPVTESGSFAGLLDEIRENQANLQR